MATESSQIEKVVLVIHGVGDPDAGDTLNRFARSLASEEKPLVEKQATVWLTEKSTVAHRTKTFPTHVRRLQINDTHTEMAEVFWGDLSQVRRGTLGLIYGVFQILFGLRYVAYVAADQQGDAAFYLKKLGLISSRMLHGPVLAVAFFLSLITAAAMATDMMWPGSYKLLLWTHGIVAACAMLALVIATVGQRLTNSRVIVRFWSWVMTVAMYSFFLIVVKAFYIDLYYPEINCESCQHPGLIWYCRVQIILLGLLWFAESGIVIAMGCCWAAASLHPRVNRPAINVAFLLPALAVGVWGQALPMIWVSAKEGITRLQRVPEFAAAFDEAIPLLGVQFVMLLLTAAAAMSVILKYFMWRNRNDIGTFLSGSRAPRLIINRVQQWMLAGCTTAGVSLVFTLCVINILGIPYRNSLFGQTLSEANKYAVVCLAPMAGLTFLSLRYLRPAFDILLDVVNHFYFRSTLMEDALEDDDEFDIKETTFESGSLYFSRRDSINNRMKRILVYYRDRLKHRPELVIVSHSQGTMVAIEVLNDPEMAWLSGSFRRTTLLTMGSPFTYLYQRYFGHLYQSLNSPRWDNLRTRVDHWVNLFRIDDFVGQEIDFPIKGRSLETTPMLAKDINASIQACTDHPLGCRGHINYWEDAEAIAEIKKEIFALDQPQENRRAA